MISFFRKIRRDLLTNSQFFKYLKYAIGEIVLVVLGILIALYINNQNEFRKEQENFNLTLVDVEKEIFENISWARDMINILAIQDSVCLKFFIDSAKFENYELYYFIMNPWGKHKIRTTSYEKLGQFKDLTKTQDSIVNELMDLRNSHFYFDNYSDHYIGIVNNRWETFMKYDWYNNWRRGTYSADEKFLNFVMNDPDYLKMATHMFSLNSEYRYAIGVYEQGALIVLKNIFDYLEGLHIRHLDSIPAQFDPEDYKHYIGKYESKWCSDKNYIHDDSIVVTLEEGKLIWNGYRQNGQGSRKEIIPINNYRFRDDNLDGIYHLKFDDHGEVEVIRYSNGPGFTLDMEKIR